MDREDQGGLLHRVPAGRRGGQPRGHAGAPALGDPGRPRHHRPAGAVQGGRLSRAVGGAEPTLGRAAREGLESADRLRTDLGDDYLSVEHVLLAFAEELGVDRDQLLSALRDVRGSHRVTSPTPEDTFQALEGYSLALTEPARRRRT